MSEYQEAERIYGQIVVVIMMILTHVNISNSCQLVNAYQVPNTLYLITTVVL